VSCHGYPSLKICGKKTYRIRSVYDFCVLHMEQEMFFILGKINGKTQYSDSDILCNCKD
jgi:hypothetical protein